MQSAGEISPYSESPKVQRVEMIFTAAIQFEFNDHLVISKRDKARLQMANQGYFNMAKEPKKKSKASERTHEKLFWTCRLEIIFFTPRTALTRFRIAVTDL